MEQPVKATLRDHSWAPWPCLPSTTRCHQFPSDFQLSSKASLTLLAPEGSHTHTHSDSLSYTHTHTHHESPSLARSEASSAPLSSHRTCMSPKPWTQLGPHLGASSAHPAPGLGWSFPQRTPHPWRGNVSVSHLQSLPPTATLSYLTPEVKSLPIASPSNRVASAPALGPQTQHVAGILGAVCWSRSLGTAPVRVQSDHIPLTGSSKSWWRYRQTDSRAEWLVGY